MSRNRLAILPGLTHYDIFLSPQLPATVLPFLDGKASSANWAKQPKEKFMSHKSLHHLTIPGESAEYRIVRNKLLSEEMALRRSTKQAVYPRNGTRFRGLLA